MPDALHSLGQLQNKSLREHIVDVLHEAILCGDLSPGQPLVETELAAQLGVSRAPLREAIQILNSEGLVETIPRRGTRVSTLERKDIVELYSLRGVLEALAIRCIIDQSDPCDLRRLEAICERMLNAANANRLRKVNDLDHSFHDTLIAMSGHCLLQTTWNLVALRVRRVMTLRNMRNDDIRLVAYSHLPILDAIRDRDGERATGAIEAHVATGVGLLAEDWEVDAMPAPLQQQDL
ncbi:MAG: GntR family transcriptional regulator [Anaerolineaceae bacterium]|nr:GntR family transcriptional regulator [Anaerolineaceae bacterium]